MIRKASTTVGLLAAHLPLDEHAPRPVEHGDAPLEDGTQSVAHVTHVVLQPPECVSQMLAGSLGVC
jgi:hypothetical protein